MAGKQVPPRSVALEDDAVSLSVREAARVLGISPYTLYGYLARGKLTKLYVDGRIMLREDEIVALRVSHQESAFGRSASYVLTIHVPVYPGCDALLTKRLSEIAAQNKHHIPGTTMQYIARSEKNPERLLILLLWPDQTRPSAELCQQVLAEFATDLEDVCNWTQVDTNAGKILSMK